MNKDLITSQTRVCGLIGDPVEHTLSPAMQNAAFRALGLDYVYVAFRVKAEALDEAIRGLRALNLRGLNVTIPHKVTVVPLLDELDPLAEKIGAVNTIVNSNGKLKGYNTDASGFLESLLARGIEPGGKRVVIVGAGGAARAVAFALAQRGARLTIINRTRDRAEDCVMRIKEYFRVETRVLSLSRENLKTALKDAEILVNTTSLGLSPNASETPVPGDLMRADMVVCDIVYQPVRTRLLGEALKAGARVIDGLDMLTFQGALGFELWTGEKAPVAIMKQALNRVLADR